jgi:hypothetical protein
MQLLKLTVLSSLLLAFAVSFISCEKDSERAKVLVYTKSDIAMTGAQSVPATPSGALGTLSVNYNKTSQLLSYTFSWTGLTDTIKSISIMGSAPVGYAATAVKQALPGITSDLKANQKNYPYQAGSYTGALYIDGIVLKEEDVLNYLYYVTIVTKTYPQGEIRGQIRFQ